MNCDGKGIEIEFEENAWRARIMRDLTSIVRYAVLGCMEWGAAGGDICGWDDVKEVLICYKICMEISFGTKQ